MDTLMTFFAGPIGSQALMGLWVAFGVDAFPWLRAEGWTVPGFSWKTASKKWIAGFLLGALAGAGLGS